MNRRSCIFHNTFQNTKLNTWAGKNTEIAPKDQWCLGWCCLPTSWIANTRVSFRLRKSIRDLKTTSLQDIFGVSSIDQRLQCLAWKLIDRYYTLLARPVAKLATPKCAKMTNTKKMKLNGFFMNEIVNYEWNSVTLKRDIEEIMTLHN